MNNEKNGALVHAAVLGAVSCLLVSMSCSVFSNQGTVTGGVVPERHIGGTPRPASDPAININGNTGLAAAADGGSGTAGDPYLIENKHIHAVNSGSSSAIYIRNTDAHVIIRNCTVTGSYHLGWGEAGIWLDNVKNANISRNIASGNRGFGIHLYRSSNNMVSGNQISSNEKDGLILDDSINNTVSNNTVSGNDRSGIYLLNSPNNRVLENRAWNNAMRGIFMYSASHGNTVSGNEVAGNSWSGISLMLSSNGMVVNNTVSDNGRHGIELHEFTNGNTVSENKVSGNAWHGTSVSTNSSYNTVSGNEVTGNIGAGINLASSSNNTVWENILATNQGSQASCSGGAGNSWDNSTHGNYWGWHDYTAKYPGATHDGTFWDTPYEIEGDEGCQDSHPLFLAMAPARVTGIVATGGNQQVDISWDTPEDHGTPITAYNVYRSGTGGGVHAFIGTNTSATGFADTGVLNGTTYVYRVAAVNLVGEGEWSDGFSATTWDVPGAPTEFTAVPGNQQVTLGWTAPAFDGGDPIFSYRVYCSLRGFMGTNMTTTGYVDTGLANGTEYTYHVTAVNEVGEGIEALVNSTTTWDVPGQVSGLTATARPNQVFLSWTGPAFDGGTPITGYKIYRDEALVMQASGFGSTEWFDTDVEVGREYVYTVVAVNDVGNGQASAPVIVKVGDDQIPGAAPVLVLACAAAGVATVLPFRWRGHDRPSPPRGSSFT